MKDEILEFSDHPSKTKDINLRTPYLTRLFFSKAGLANKFKGFSFKGIQNLSGADSTMIRVTKAKGKKKTPVFVDATDTGDWASEAAASERFSTSVSASIIASALIQAKKPIIGHHFSLDLGFIINQLVTELPATYSEYRSVVTSVFPYIYDTKYIAGESILKDQFGQSNLERITHVLTQDPQYQAIPSVVVDADPKFRKYHSGTQAHEAGYDAYITGFDFACMGYMLLLNNPEKPKLTPENFWQAIKMFENNVYLSNHYKHCMNLRARDDVDDMSDIRFKYVVQVESDLSITALSDSLCHYGDIRLVRNGPRDFIVRIEQIDSEYESLDAVVAAMRQELGLAVRKMAE